MSPLQCFEPPPRSWLIAHEFQPRSQNLPGFFCQPVTFFIHKWRSAACCWVFWKLLRLWGWFKKKIMRQVAQRKFCKKKLVRGSLPLSQRCNWAVLCCGQCQESCGSGCYCCTPLPCQRSEPVPSRTLFGVLLLRVCTLFGCFYQASWQSGSSHSLQ